MTADLDGGRLVIEAEADGNDMGRITTDRCQSAEPLPVQVFDLVLGKRIHPDLLSTYRGRAHHQSPLA